MVSTRRTAQKEPIVQQDLETTTKKKPVRRATAKQAEPDTKTRTVKGKKVATIAEEEAAKDKKATTATARTKPIARKTAEKPVKAAAAAPSTTKTAAKPTRATRTTKKVEVSIQNTPDLSAPSEKQPVRRTRAAVTKAQPLSPKKITQVSKPAPRNARATSDKAPAKKGPVQKPALKSRTTRKRAPSDENADVSISNSGTRDQEEEAEEEIRVEIRPAKNSRIEATKQHDDSELTMSSRPTTPSDSGVPALDDYENATAEPDSDSSEEEQVDGSDSEDELCGPKTPMKRSSPGAHAKYIASVQNTVKRHNSEVPDQTPARRFERAGKTPVTQKLRPTAFVPTSEARPLTVARGGDRAFVFRDLRQPSLPEEHEAETSDLDDFTMFEGVDKTESMLSSPTQTNLLRDVSTDEVEDSILGHAPQQQLTDESLLIDPELEAEASDSLLIDPEVQAEASESESEDDEASDDTVIVREPVEVQDQPQDSQNSTVVEVEEEDDAPETMVWENLRPDVTIQVDFDAHFNGSSMLPQAEPTEMLDIALEDTVSSSALGSSANAAVGQAEEETPQRLSIDSIPQLAAAASRRGTLNMAGFINMNSNGEPSPIKLRQEIDCPVPDSLEATQIAFTEISQTSPRQRPGVDIEMQETSSLEEETSIHEEHQTVEPPSSPEQEPAIHGGLNIKEGPIVEDARVVGEPLPSDDVVTPTDFEAGLDTHIRTTTVQHEVVQSETSGVKDSPPAAEQKDHLADEVLEETDVPHYALSTFAFDVRRKSLPAISFQTPTKCRTRPITSDGASMPRVRMPFQPFYPFNLQQACATPRQAGLNTRAEQDQYDTALETAAFRPATPGERYPRLNPENSYAAHAKTVAPPRRFVTPVKTPAKRPASARKPDLEFATPRASSLRPRAVKMPEASFESDLRSPVAKRMAMAVADTAEDNIFADEEVVTPKAPTPGERFPKLPARTNYEQLSQTVAGPQRFRTPLRSPAKRPSTAQKSAPLRKQLAIKSKTPMKTPLKAAAMTPGQIPMTPHPAAPLKGVMAMVEVFTMEGACASTTFVAALHCLGAKTTKTWSDRVTHVVFKEGSPTTLQRIRLHNKDVAETGAGTHIYCVNSRWVNDCETEGKHVDESTYECDLDEVPRGGQRRRKSMEPGVFHNIGGNVVRDRTSSWGKNSLRRSLAKMDSPGETTPQNDPHATPKAVITHLSDDEGSPATPDWLHPEKLVQQTAPLKRVRKLDLETKENRRMTGWDGVKF